MNNLVKLGIAGGLALGSLAAQAGITVGTSSTPGNAILFADIFNGTTLVKAYAGDTGFSLTALAGGATGSFEDANLTSFLAADAPGDTVDWLVVGAGGNSGPAPATVVSTGGTLATALNTIRTQNGATLVGWNIELTPVVNLLNGLIAAGSTPTANSWLGTNNGTTAGNSFAPFGTTNDASNLGGSTGQVATAGLGSVTLYSLSAASQSGGAPASITPVLDVSLSSANGLTFSAISTAPVPVPAAIWLLGSGLLGLAGVSRRKSAAV
ncbi:MAG: VPLPA-CTERM sorting domain-containing protein [Steroidobacteraceae bacterium]|jgi:hypothetical protein